MNGATLLQGRRLAGLLAALGAAIAGAGYLGWQAGQPHPIRAAAAAPIAWALPVRPAFNPAADIAILQARRPWGGTAAFQDPDTPAPVQTPWQLAGTLQRDGAWFALIRTGQGPAGKLDYRGIGETLPDGSVLVQIGADGATSQQGQSSSVEQRVHHLFVRKQ